MNLNCNSNHYNFLQLLLLIPILSQYLFYNVQCFTILPFQKTSITSNTPNRIIHGIKYNEQQRINNNVGTRPLLLSNTKLSASNKEKIEESRMNILKARRKQIRATLKSAEKLRNYRTENGLFAESEEDESKEQSKFAIGITAFFVAIGYVILRIGGRAALVSAIGLDFTNENPELQTQLQSFLDYTNEFDIVTKSSIFILGWCLVKIFCFDIGGVVLALSSGILFDNVLIGAVMSAGSATIGSVSAFLLAKVDTPIRKKALELFDEYPSLRGIDKVVAKDGIKAILTLRLAPILPIPIGLYNYVYGVTNVPITDFAIGIFLGSLKPYLLDSYLGYFGKSVLQGNTDSSTEDILLLVIIGFSILIGVFASQLATETWESVQDEVEKEKRLKDGITDEDDTQDDGILRNVMGLDVPDFAVGLQLTFQKAIENLDELINVEYEAKVWNYTNVEEEPIPKDIDPAFFSSSPEVMDKYKGIDFGLALCDGFSAGFVLLQSFLTYADPLFVEVESKDGVASVGGVTTMDTATIESTVMNDQETSSNYDEKELLLTLSLLKNRSLVELESINSKLDDF